MTNFFLNTAQQLGLPEDQFRVVFCWLAAIPMGFIFKQIQTPLYRHWVSLIFGLMLTYICVQEWMYLTVFAALVVYGMLKFLGKKSDWPSFFFLFALLTLINIHRYIYDFYGWKVDGSISLMILLCKMTYITFYYCDGRLNKIPSLLEYFSYLLFFPSAFCGPTFDLQTYLDFINLKGNYKDKFSVRKATFIEMFLAIFYLGVLTYFEPNPNNYFQEPFLSYSFITKLFYISFVTLIQRFRYYGAWKFAQASVNATGFSYNGKNSDGSPNFDKIITMKFEFETSLSPRVKTEAWNTSIQGWLKNVFYTRFQSYKYSPQKSLFLVFCISALWHGVHPVYYLGFLYWAALNELGKRLYKEKERFDFIPKYIKNPILFIIVVISYNQIGMTINILDMYKVIEIQKQFYFIPLFLPFLLIVVSNMTRFGLKKKQNQKTNNIKETNNRLVNGTHLKDQ